MAVPATTTATSQSSATEMVSPSDPATGETSPPFWPTNGNSGSQQQQQAQTQDSPESLSDSLAQVSLSSSSSSQSATRSPVSAASFTATPSVLLSSGSSSYWSTAAGCDTENPFLNGSPYSPGYSSGGSSSGSPQSPLTRPTSRPITGMKAAHIQPTGMFYPKTQCADKSTGWKSGPNVWGPYSGPKPAVLPNMAQNAMGPNFGQKEKEWKDTRISSSQYPQHQQHVPFASSAYRQSLNSATRPASMSGGRPVMQQQHQQQQLPPQQQQQEWQVGPGGWGSSLNFHAARKFGRRRGNVLIL